MFYLTQCRFYRASPRIFLSPLVHSRVRKQIKNAPQKKIKYSNHNNWKVERTGGYLQYSFLKPRPQKKYINIIQPSDCMKIMKTHRQTELDKDLIKTCPVNKYHRNTKWLYLIYAILKDGHGQFLNFSQSVRYSSIFD